MEILKSTLNCLKERFKTEKLISLIHTRGLTYDVTCEFNSPASPGLVEKLEEELGRTIPQDYKEFLLLHNGANLLFQPDVGEGIELYSIEMVLEMRKAHQDMSVFEKELFSIGTCRFGMILIDAVICKPNPHRDSNYLFWLEECASENEAINLNSNFEIWLDRIIAAQGEDYWNWSILSAENMYK
jgi:hypothetical protein